MVMNEMAMGEMSEKPWAPIGKCLLWTKHPLKPWLAMQSASELGLPWKWIHIRVPWVT